MDTSALYVGIFGSSAGTAEGRVGAGRYHRGTLSLIGTTSSGWLHPQPGGPFLGRRAEHFSIWRILSRLLRRADGRGGHPC
jgi:hypothetical protein